MKIKLHVCEGIRNSIHSLRSRYGAYISLVCKLLKITPEDIDSRQHADWRSALTIRRTAVSTKRLPDVQCKCTWLKEATMLLLLPPEHFELLGDWLTTFSYGVEEHFASRE